MQFALVDNNRLEAAKGLKGICPYCSSNLIAKCGEKIINHWAHKAIRNCDPWWENETEWHRRWKNKFAKDWQEKILHDEVTGEKHIADIKTIHGLVVEFQHSHLHRNERTKREAFYKKMVWVVDGTRLKKDYPRFLKEHGNFLVTNTRGYYHVSFPEKCFHFDWLGSSVPVLFDFGSEIENVFRDMRNLVYCLFPKNNRGQTIVAFIPREHFIEGVKNGMVFKKWLNATF